MAAPITIVSARFEDLVSIGLRKLILEDPNLSLVASDIELDSLEGVLDEQHPSVVLLNFGSLPQPAMIYQLHQSHPETRVVVLANRPTAAECNQMLSFGATACISKETQGRDVINAIHLASRGMHVLPRSAAASEQEEQQFGLPAPELLTPRDVRDLVPFIEEKVILGAFSTPGVGVVDSLRAGTLMRNKQIAGELSIGVETVRTHTRNIYAKLGVSTRRDLARFTRRTSDRAAEPVGLPQSA